MDYKATLNLPKTDFPMKADLAKREPQLLDEWKAQNLYGRILEARKDAPLFVFHDGPPYANGHIHYGHILNKLLKDLVVKSRTMAGHLVIYKPGWDCHGLPIELQVLREHGDKAGSLSAAEVRRACHEYAMKWVRIQGQEFERLGVFGQWDAPYLTLSKSYEATIVRQLAAFVRKGLIYRDKKPVHWCVSDKTALAEAEIEYDPAHVSPSIFVKFAVPAEPGLFAVIWTTTPWTLPANWAIAYHPDFAYVTVEVGGERLIVAEKLADQLVEVCKLKETGPRRPLPTAELARLGKARHPFLDRDSIFVPADYVTLEQGTGLVHTAPGHGADDYRTGKKHGLPVDAPVDDAGRFTEGRWQGKSVWKANPEIVAYLAELGALLSPPSLKVTHAYPTCWRCKQPVIFRATAQWFAKMDHPIDGEATLRQRALDEIGKTRWIPPWGENRIRGMIENRPDWVLSRQRVWGVPIPVLEKDGEWRADADLMDRVAEVFAKEGANAWFEKSAEELLGPDFAGWQKGGDIVDVWFESGVSWAAVCEGQPGLDGATPADPRPIDLYLEGSDQHRGWFHSSLLASTATRGHAPYRAVLTHGFILDERGKPYSKSEIERARKEGIKIEYTPPEELIRQKGAELLRMWVAQADFRSDVTYSSAHLVQLGETYRRIRNTARFLLGNLDGFDPARDPVDTLDDPLDRWMADRVAAFVERATQAYEAYEFHTVLREINQLCTVDLSALYLDIRKDRLYCDAAGAPERRATRTVLYQALRALATLLAPICCFTAEEIWRHMPRRADDPDSVHLARFPAPGPRAAVDVPMEALLEWRGRVQKALEPFRAQKKASLDAAVTLVMPAAQAEALGLARLGPAWLADFFIVSSVALAEGPDEVRVAEAPGHRCERCWKWTPDEPLCARCQRAVA